MHEWINVLLAPWKADWDENNMSGKPPLLVLDAHHVHQMGSVVNQIQLMGIEVVHIPARCTYLCQPINVGINTPIKSRLRDKWEEWMMEGGGIINWKAQEPTRKMVVDWFVEMYSNMPVEIGKIPGSRQGLSGFKCFYFNYYINSHPLSTILSSINVLSYFNVNMHTQFSTISTYA